jgi:hypothetical protein
MKKQLFIILSFAALTGISFQICGMEKEEDSNESTKSLPNNFITSQEIPPAELATKKLPPTVLAKHVSNKNQLGRITALQRRDQKITEILNKIKIDNQKTAKLVNECVSKANKKFAKKRAVKKKFAEYRRALEAFYNEEKTKLSFWSRTCNFTQGVFYSFIAGSGIYYMLKERKTGLLESNEGRLALGATVMGLPALIKFRQAFFPSRTLYNTLKPLFEKQS